jgi:hypothetical protein
MAYTAVTITTLTTITSADLNQLRDNATYLRDEYEGRVVATKLWETNNSVAGQTWRVRVEVGGSMFTGVWHAHETPPQWYEITGLSAMNVQPLVPDRLHMVNVYLEGDQGALPLHWTVPYMHTHDTLYLALFGEAKEGWTRNLSLMASHTGALPATS